VTAERDPAIRTRAATEDELVYVRCTWLASVLGRRRASNGERQRARQVVDALLTERVLVAVQPSPLRPEEVVGWICYTPTASTAVVHYVYVRERCRREKIATDLLAAAGVDATRAVLATHASDMLPIVLRSSGLRVAHVAAEDVLT
jgi:4'-phosphopantetheinyl transferase EntD